MMSRVKRLFGLILLLPCAAVLILWIGIHPAAANPSAATPTSVFDVFLALVMRQGPTPTPYVPPVASHLLITEVMAHPIADGTEWLEVLNPTQTSLNLYDFKIGDAETWGDNGEGMLRFPQGTVIAPSQIIVIAADASAFFRQYGMLPDYEWGDSLPTVPEMQKYTAWAGGNINLTNTGDEVLLLDKRDTLIDEVSWGSSTLGLNPPVDAVVQGHTYERQPSTFDSNTAQDWVDQMTPSPGTANTLLPVPTHTATPTLTPTPTRTPSPTIGPSPTPFSGALYLSEVFYRPVGGGAEGEWIEIYNATTETLFISPFKIGDEEAQGGGEGMYQFPPDCYLVPGQVLVVANDAAVFLAKYGYLPDVEIRGTHPDVPDMIKVDTWGSGSLNLGTNDEVLLMDGTNQIIDAVSWGSSTWAFAPSIPGTVDGYSLERYPAHMDTDTAFDWRAQSEPSPGKLDTTPPTYTPSPTLTASPTQTPSPSRTVPHTSSPTRTPTQTETPEHTPTPSTTLTPSVTATSSASPTITPTPTATAVLSLLISEVLYDAAAEPDGEWVEVYNAGSVAVSLEAIKIGDEETQGNSEGMLKFPTGAEIAPDQLIVLAREGKVFSDTYGVQPDYEIVDTLANIPDMVAYSAWGSANMQLSNTGDEILLLGPTDELLDSVSWGTSAWAFDPAAIDVPEGHSLERFPFTQDSDTAADWRDQSVPSPGLAPSHRFAKERPLH